VTPKVRRQLIIGILAALIVAAALYVVWAFTLCGGNCGAPATLPPA
jgi:hypothetical protein